MKFTALFFIFAIVSSVFALPAASPQGELVHHVPLSKRNINFPARADDVLAAKIMAQLKLNLDTLVFASISATFSEKVAASLKIHASILGGLIKVGQAQLKLIESAAIKNLKVSFDASLNAKIQAHIYNPLEASLHKHFDNKELNESLLLDIFEDLNVKAKTLITTELPKIAVELEADAKEAIELAVKSVEVDIPLILQIKVDANVKEQVFLRAAIQVALDICAKLDAKAIARLILQRL